jgi:hypothetical protein
MTQENEEEVKKFQEEKGKSRADAEKKMKKELQRNREYSTKVPKSKKPPRGRPF